MPRLIKKTDQKPLKVGDKFICMCGLSKKQPFCDGSHQQTLDEDKDKLYTYKDGERQEVKGKKDCCGSCCKQ
jgi:CDGSH-type Zn-finger protein